MISDFRAGLFFWWRGWRHLFQHRALLALSLVPIAISLAFFVGFIYLLWSHLGGWVNALIVAVGANAGGFWYSLAYYPLVIGGGLIIFLSLLYLSVLAHSLVAVPFYSVLADRTLAQQGKRPLTLSWYESLRMIRASALKSLLLLMIGVLLFLMSLIPILDVFAISGAMLILAFDCMDYAFDGMGYSFGQRAGYLFRERVQWLGMASGLALTLLVPGLTLLVIPGAVVGCALILKEQKPK